LEILNIITFATKIIILQLKVFCQFRIKAV